MKTTIEIRTITDKTLRIEINNVRKSFRFDIMNLHPTLARVFKYLNKINLGHLYSKISVAIYKRISTDKICGYGTTLTYFTV